MKRYLKQERRREPPTIETTISCHIMKLTIFFNGQFWEGVIEVDHDGVLKAGRHLFGAEPSNIEVLSFVSDNHASTLVQQTQSTAVAPTEHKATNPKRRSREAAKEMAVRGASTMAQMVLQQELEQHKKESKKRSKADDEAKEAEKRRIIREKAKARHRGKA